MKAFENTKTPYTRTDVHLSCLLCAGRRVQPAYNLDSHRTRIKFDYQSSQQPCFPQIVDRYCTFSLPSTVTQCLRLSAPQCCSVEALVGFSSPSELPGKWHFWVAAYFILSLSVRILGCPNTAGCGNLFLDFRLSFK